MLDQSKIRFQDHFAFWYNKTKKELETDEYFYQVSRFFFQNSIKTDFLIAQNVLL